jgi:hypothetical protein
VPAISVGPDERVFLQGDEGSEQNSDPTGAGGS